MEAEYIARISYGKDSLKMLDVIKSRGLPLDRITTTDVWATDTISANLPPMEAFKARMDERIWQLYHIEVEHLCARNPDGSRKTYEQMFYHIPVRKSGGVQTGNDTRIPRSVESVVSGWTQTECLCTERKGPSQATPPPTPVTTGAKNSKLCKNAIKGFPLASGITYCQKLKVRVQTPRIPGANLSMVPKTQNRQGQAPFSSERGLTTRKDRNIVEYLGIASDEPKRFGQLNAKKRAPLVEFGIDEDLCGLYCQYNDMLSPSYETSCRDGCWFCHNQGVSQLRSLRHNYPELWALLMKWDLDSPVSFKADGHTVHDYDRRFQMEDRRMIPSDRTFRWEMLDRPPKFIPMTGEQISIF